MFCRCQYHHSARYCVKILYINKNKQESNNSIEERDMNTFTAKSNKQGDGSIPPMQQDNRGSVAGGVARFNVDGRPIMGGRLMSCGGGGGSSAAATAGGYQISSMGSGYANAQCSAFPLWVSTNNQYSLGGMKTSTNWVPLAASGRGI